MRHLEVGCSKHMMRSSSHIQQAYADFQYPMSVVCTGMDDLSNGMTVLKYLAEFLRA